MPFEKEVIDLEGCRPIDAQKILYWKDARFADRLLPPPDVPPLKLDLHRARLEGRVKALPTITDVRTTPLEAIDVNLLGLELPIDPTPEQVAAFNKTFYDRMATREAAPDDDSDDEAPDPRFPPEARHARYPRAAPEPSPSLS